MMSQSVELKISVARKSPSSMRNFGIDPDGGRYMLTTVKANDVPVPPIPTICRSCVDGGDADAKG